METNKQAEPVPLFNCSEKKDRHTKQEIKKMRAKNRKLKEMKL